MLPRWLTGRIGWVLDNLLPPLLRDSRRFMAPFFRLLFGSQASAFMTFKEVAPFLSPDEYRGWYERLAGAHIQRETDLSPRALAAVLSAAGEGSVLDVGSGRGYLAERLAERVRGPVVGIDFVGAAGTHARFVRGDAEHLPFQTGSFDTVVCCHVLEHIQDVDAAIAELRRVARRRVVVVVPRQREYPYTFDLHVRFFPYVFSVHQLMRRPGAVCQLVDSDFLYVEENEPDAAQAR